MNLRIVGIIILTVLFCRTVFAQDHDIEEQPELFELVTGVSEETFVPSHEIIFQSFTSRLDDAGFTSPVSLSSQENLDILPLWLHAVDSTRTEVRNEILNVLSDEELREIQRRSLLFNFYSDWSPISEMDMEEGGRFYMVSEILFHPCETLELTPDQEQLYREIRGETIQEMFVISVENERFYQEIADLRHEAEDNDTAPEIVEKKVAEIHEKIKQLELEGIKRINKNFRTRFETILTDKQKAKLQKMKDEMPESLWKIMPGNFGKERPWKPGANSWMPGMGVPENIENHPAEKKHSRAGDGKQFPGQEENNSNAE